MESPFMNRVDKLKKLDKPGKKNPVSTKVLALISKLSKLEDVMLIPTDKTNEYRVVKLADYIRWCPQHLAKDAIQIDRPRLTEIHERSEKYLEECSGF